MTLEEVIDLVNFSRLIIEDGELNVIYFLSPKKSSLLPENGATQHAKIEFERWKREYEKEKGRRNIDPTTDKLNIQNAMDYFEGHITYLMDGRALYTEQNIAFQLKPDADLTDNLTDPDGSLLYRLYAVDRFNQYDDNEPTIKSKYLAQSMPLSIDYHNLLIFNREYRLHLSSSPQMSIGSVEPPRDAAIHVPFNLMGRQQFPFQIEDVVNHYWENTDTGRYLTIEIEPDSPEGFFEKFGHGIEGAITKVWLDPELDYCVVRDEYYLYGAQGKLKISDDTYSEFKLFPGDIWFPTRIEGKMYSVRKPNTIDMEYFYIVREAAFNIGMPHFFFDLDIKEVLSTGIKTAPYDR